MTETGSYHLMQELESFHAPNGELQFESQIGGKPTLALSVVLNQWGAALIPVTLRLGIMKVQHTATWVFRKACLLHVVRYISCWGIWCFRENSKLLDKLGQPLWT